VPHGGTAKHAVPCDRTRVAGQPGRLQAAGDALQQVVEVVREPAGELAHRFHLLRLAQLLPRLGERLSGFPLGSDVAPARIDERLLGRGDPEMSVSSGEATQDTQR